MNRSLPVVVVALLACPAHAETQHDLFESLWPHVADAEPAPTLRDRFTQRLLDYGYRYIANPVDVVTHRSVQVGIDPKRQTAKLAVHGGDARVVAVGVAFDLGVASSIAAQVAPRFQPEPGRERDYVGDARSNAVVRSRLALSIAGKRIAFDLPKLEVGASEYRGSRGVELTLPFVRRTL
jgi:hypothetical protein